MRWGPWRPTNIDPLNDIPPPRGGGEVGSGRAGGRGLGPASSTPPRPPPFRERVQLRGLKNNQAETLFREKRLPDLPSGPRPIRQIQKGGPTTQTADSESTPVEAYSVKIADQTIILSHHLGEGKE